MRPWKVFAVLMSSLTIAPFLVAQPMRFVTFAGFPTGSGSADGPAAAARFNQPRGVVVAPDGTVYVTESINSQIRRVGPDGIVTTVAGARNIPGSTDGPGPMARFRNPDSIALDNQGNLYVADTGNHTIRKITPAGVVSTLAGSAGATGSSDGSGAAARFDSPSSIAGDGTVLYVAERNNHIIRKVTLSGQVTTLAGAAGSSGSADGTGNGARFLRPTGLAIDRAGNLIVADTSNHTIRSVTAEGVVTTLAGVAGSNGAVDGPVSSSRFAFPIGIAIDAAGTIFVTELSRNHIRKIAGGVVSRHAGQQVEAGSADGPGLTVARFRAPDEMASDAAGNLYVADSGNHTIRRIDALQNVTTFAGKASTVVDGEVSRAEFLAPGAIARDPAGNLYVVDGHSIRQISPAGTVRTFAGDAEQSGFREGVGTDARFFGISAIAFDGGGNLFATTFNDRVMRITPDGTVRTYAGSGQRGGADGSSASAQFNVASGIAIDAAGNVFVSDTGNGTIRKITPSGEVTTLAGVAGMSGTSDGAGSAARFMFPGKMSIDSAGNLYVADANRLRKITPSGMVSTVATNRITILNLALTEAGEIFISDTHTIRRLRADGTFELVGGQETAPGLAPRGGFADGRGADARFDTPTALLWVGSQLYIVDTGNNAIRIGYYDTPRRRAVRP